MHVHDDAARRQLALERRDDLRRAAGGRTAAEAAVARVARSLPFRRLLPSFPRRVPGPTIEPVPRPGR